MNKILIQHTTDEHDCETCGPSYAESHMTEFNGKIIGNNAVASCFGAENFSLEDILIQIIKELGYKVEVNYIDYE